MTTSRTKVKSPFRALAVLLATVPIVSVHAVNTSTERQINLRAPSQDLPVTREYFYVGGHYTDNGAGQHILKNQMYVEKLSSAYTSKQCPLVFIHGQAQTGTNWLNKPDGSPCWATYFLSQGYTLYVVDQTFRGRSPWTPGNGTISIYPAELFQQRFTAPEKYNLWPQASLHTQWPGDGVMGDPYFDAYYASTVQFLASATCQQSTVQAAGASLLDKIGKPVILVAHSQGGIMPWLIADARPELTRAIVSLEPSGPPFHEAVVSNATARPYGLTDIPITYHPPVTKPAQDIIRQTIPAAAAGLLPCVIQADDPPPRQLVNLRKIPVLLLTTEASYHAPYDWCTVKYLQQAGVNTTHMELGKLGIHGNGHMMFLEKNSEEIAKLIQDWIETAEES